MNNVANMADDLRDAYRAVFDCPAGKKVIDDLERIAFKATIDLADPNPNAALYRCAQLDLVKRIRNMIKKGE